MIMMRKSLADFYTQEISARKCWIKNVLYLRYAGKTLAGFHENGEYEWARIQNIFAEWAHHFISPKRSLCTGWRRNDIKVFRIRSLTYNGIDC